MLKTGGFWETPGIDNSGVQSGEQQRELASKSRQDKDRHPSDFSRCPSERKDGLWLLSQNIFGKNFHLRKIFLGMCSF